VAFVRQVAMYLAHVGFALGSEAVGQNFGRDRTKVSLACRVVEDSRDDLWLDCRLAVLERLLRGTGRGSPRGAAMKARDRTHGKPALRTATAGSAEPIDLLRALHFDLATRHIMTEDGVVAIVLVNDSESPLPGSPVARAAMVAA
jgi:hypothetical protein